MEMERTSEVDQELQGSELRLIHQSIELTVQKDNDSRYLMEKEEI